MDGHTRVHAIVLVPGDGGPLIPPGASLVTHAALLTRPSPVPALVPRVRVYPRVRPALPSTSTRRRGILSFFLSFGSPPVPPIPPLRLSVRLFLFHSPAPLQPATPHRRRASGDTRGPTQVMHGPPYIFDPLFGLLFPTERTMPLPLPLSPLPLPRTRARAFLFLLALSRARRDHDCPRLSFDPPATPAARLSRSAHLRRVQHASSEHPRRNRAGNACYCPSFAQEYAGPSASRCDGPARARVTRRLRVAYRKPHASK